MVEWKGFNRGRLAINFHWCAGLGKLATEVPESQDPFAARKRNPRCAGDLADVPVTRADLGAGLRRFGLEGEARERAMNIAPGPNSLDDLLPDVTALREVQYMRLSCFLRQIAVAKVHTEARHPARDSVLLKRLRTHRFGPGKDEDLPDLVEVVSCEPDLVTFALRLRVARNGDAGVAPHSIEHLAGLKRGNVNAGGLQQLRRARSNQADGRELSADIADFNVIHDDVLVENRCDLRTLVAIRRHQQVVA